MKVVFPTPRREKHAELLTMFASLFFKHPILRLLFHERFWLFSRVAVCGNIYIVTHMTPARQRLGKHAPKVTLSTTEESLKAGVVYCWAVQFELLEAYP
jgi:hypothetical protein